MLMRTLCRKTIKKGTPNSPMNGGQGVEVSKTLFYAGDGLPSVQHGVGIFCLTAI